MRRFAQMNFQITDTVDSKLSYKPYYRYVKFTNMKLYWYKMRFSPYHGQMRAKSKKEAKENV